MRELAAQLVVLRQRLRLGGGSDRVEKQHVQGKLTARERVALLLDEAQPWVEVGLLVAHDQYDGQAPAAGVVTGVGRVHGREVVVVANDATVKAGSWWPETIRKMLCAQEIAMRCRIPIVYLVDSAGVNLPYQEGVFPGQYGAARLFYGEFKRSSQHLEEELRWRQSGAEERIELYVDGCVHQAVRRWDAASIGRGSGKRSLEVCRARRLPWRQVCPPLSGRAGFAHVVACHPSIFVLSRGAISRSLSEKRSPFFEPVVVACARSPGSCAAHRRRSRENCGGTQQREVETSSIEPGPPDGMPIGERSVRKLPNSLRTAN